MLRNSVNSAFGLKTAITIVFSDHDFLYTDARATSISYKTDAFPLPSDVHWIYSIFCATTSHDLVTLTFDLLTLKVCHVQCFSCPTHIPILIILWLSYEYRISDHISVIWNSHCACAVSRDL